MNHVRGTIFSEEAYAQAKMLDHSGWTLLLPRKITPSDIDMVIDNNGVLLFVELSSKTPDWTQLSKGQRLLYENIVWAGHGFQKAALCKITPQPDKQINTTTDIEAFSVMVRKGNDLITSKIFDGRFWTQAVTELLKKPTTIEHGQTYRDELLYLTKTTEATEE